MDVCFVFPTHVGVFPDAPDYVKAVAESSPRMWGCFLRKEIERRKQNVFPTHVGVFLPDALPEAGEEGLPHACGGVSGIRYFLSRVWVVFPTHVGVFP